MYSFAYHFYLPPLNSLRVVLSILGLAQQVREHQRLEGAGARGPGVPERVHHPEFPSVAHGAEGARAKATRRVQAVNADHGRRGCLLCVDTTEVRSLSLSLSL